MANWPYLRFFVGSIFFVLLFFCQKSFGQSYVEGQVSGFEGGLFLTDARAVVIYKGDTLDQYLADSAGYYRVRFQRNADLYIFREGYQPQRYRLSRKSRPSFAVRLRSGMMGLLDSLSPVGAFPALGYGDRLDQVGYLIEDGAASRPEDRWQGRLDGLWIQSGGGWLEAAPRLHIRGPNSLYAHGQPLLVIDGLPIWQTPLGLESHPTVHPLLDFPAAAFGQVQVHQDAPLAAHWGARGGNGILSLNTLRPPEAGQSWRAGYQGGITRPSVRPAMLSAQQYQELFTEAAQNAGFNPDQIEFFRRIYRINDSTETGWDQFPYRTGFFQRADVGFSRRDSSGYFTADLSLGQVSAFVQNHDQQHIHLRTAAQQHLGKRASIAFQLAGSYLHLNRLQAQTSPLNLLTQIPSTPDRDPETGLPNPNTYAYNALFEDDGTKDTYRRYRVMGTFRGQYQIKDWLTAAAVLGGDFLRQFENVSHAPNTLLGQPDGRDYTRHVQAHTARAALELLGQHQQQQHRITYQLSADYQHYAADTIRERVSGGSRPPWQAQQYAFGGFNAWVSYALRQRYHLQLNGRRERATTFGREQDWQNFYALAGAWTISKEQFLRPISHQINFLQLRASWGVSGNAGYDPLFAQGSLSRGQYGDDPTLTPRRAGNARLKPERTQNLDLGLRLAFLQDKIALEVSYFDQQTHDLILNAPLPATSGYDNQWQNLGRLQNNGWQIRLRTHNHERFWDWFSELHLTFLRSQIQDLNGQTLTEGIHRFAEGLPYAAFYAPRFLGVDAQTGQVLYTDANGEPTSDLSAAAPQLIGQPLPKIWAGFSNRFVYEWLSVEMLWQAALGHHLYDAAHTRYANDWATFHNQTTDALQRWQNPGDQTDIPRPVLLNPNGQFVSSRHLKRADYLRLQRLRVGYTPQKLPGRPLQIFLQGENLWTLTRPETRHLDPTIADFVAGDLKRNLLLGRQNLSLPTAWSVSLGLRWGITAPPR